MVGVFDKKYSSDQADSSDLASLCARSDAAAP
jgi:hypothetical protein